MKIGITYDLKETGSHLPGLPDDHQEEFDSPTTIEAIAAVLRSMGHDVVKLGDGRRLLERLLADPPDFVFNFAEGQGVGRSREARVPAVLEMLGIPYSGSDPLTLAVTLDKDCAKRLVASAGVAVPSGSVLRSPFSVLRSSLPVTRTENGERRMENGECDIAEISFPAIVKPAWEGSSKGIRNRCVVNNPSELNDVVEEMQRNYAQPVLIEEFIAGDELTVGVIGNDEPKIVAIMRVVPTQRTERFVYSLEVKRDYLRQVRYECPAELSPQDSEAVRKAALTTYKALGCRDVARVDFRLRDGVPYFLEVNPLPGLNPESSDLVIMANLAGWSYERLIRSIVLAAFERQSIVAG